MLDYLPLLAQYADKLYGPEFPSDECLSDDDISSALARETDSLKEKKERRFTAVQSGAKHLVFIVCGPPVEPCVLVHSMLTEVATKGERVSRYCQRMLPVVSVCHADMSDIRKHALVVLEPHFHTSHDTIIKVCCSKCISLYRYHELSCALTNSLSYHSRPPPVCS